MLGGEWTSDDNEIHKTLKLPKMDPKGPLQGYSATKGAIRNVQFWKTKAVKQKLQSF